MKVYEPHKSSIGNMDANVMALLTYVSAIILSFIPFVQYVSWLLPLIFFYMEKNSTLVKFHALQAFALFLVSAIIDVIINVIVAIAGASTAAAIASDPYDLNSYFGAWAGVAAASVIVGIIGLVFLIFGIIAMVRAFKYEEYAMPVFGKLAAKFAGKFNK